MALAVGTKLGPYEIVAPIGAGGMGEVYRAHDSKLGRDVALKTLPKEFAVNPERLARFRREARTLASLNHPNIAAIYGLEESGDGICLVLELVEGEILRGPLPLDRALEYARQVAEALEAAHENGIIHRDLKPANVKVTPKGRVKVLDFGLAKAVWGVEENQDLSQRPTVTEIGSGIGKIVGTPAYMSPEQARGKLIDKRVDVWAFGCLLYELISGAAAFRRGTVPDTIAAVLEREPDFSALPAKTPSKVRELLRGCLQKDVSRRPPDMSAVRRLVEEIIAPRRRGLSRARAYGVGLAVIVVGLVVWFQLRIQRQPVGELLHAVPLTTYPGTQEAPSFSPDGTQVAFSWNGEKQDNFDIYVKRIGPGPPLRLTHDMAPDSSPAWSPDGGSIAFLRREPGGRDSVRLIPPLGGPERMVAELDHRNREGQSLTWSPDSKWLAVSDQPTSQAGGLWLLSLETGERRRLTVSPNVADVDFSPAFAPDGHALAFARTSAPNAQEVYLLPLGDGLRPRGEPRQLTHDNQGIAGLAWTGDSRDLVYSSGAPGSASLWRMRATVGTLPTRLTDQREVYDLAISGRSRRLAFVQSRRELDIYRAELSGNGKARTSTSLIASSRLERFPAYSPNGQKIAFVSLRSGNWQLWMSDSEGANAVQMTSFERGEVAMPTWRPDSRQIGFSSNAEGPYQAYVVDVAGGRVRKLDSLGSDVRGFTWSRDGQWLLFNSSRSGARHLWRLSVNGGTPEQLTSQLAPAAGPPFQSRENGLLYFIRNGGVWSVPPDGGQERQVFHFDLLDGAILQADRTGIYFIAQRKGTAFQEPGDLLFYHFPSGPITEVGLQGRYGFSLSPDGRYLLYTKFTATGSDLMVVDSFR